VKRKQPKLLDAAGLARLALESLIRLDPRRLARNPVMLVVGAGTLVTLALTAQDIWVGRAFGFDLAIALVLLCTVLFANAAEALAEARGRDRRTACAPPAIGSLPIGSPTKEKSVSQPVTCGSATGSGYVQESWSRRTGRSWRGRRASTSPRSPGSPPRYCARPGRTTAGSPPAPSCSPTAS
jgi:hypothetical protein